MAKDEEKKAASKAGFDASGKPYAGVDPETGKRVTVTLDALKSEFGPKRGAEIYARIGEATGTIPRGALDGETGHYTPDISLAGLGEDVSAKVDGILAGKE